MINIDGDLCIKCNLCVSICSQSVLKREPENIRINSNFECMDCAECIDICPVEAISKSEEE